MAHDYFIREATPDDAEALIAFIKTLADEPDNGTTFSSSAEFPYTVEQERELIRQYNESENALWIVAVTPDDTIIGEANFMGGKRAGRRTVILGISVALAWRNRGVGTSMMRFVIDWCRLNPAIHRLELGVFTNNPRAIHVYEKLGFVHEGTRKQAFYKHGRYLDAHIMAIVFDDDEAS